MECRRRRVISLSKQLRRKTERAKLGKALTYPISYLSGSQDAIL
jgi:hypothetical protein